MLREFNFPNVSAGYCGIFTHEGTINSKYYALLKTQIQDNEGLLQDVLILPQRIQRTGFFEELYEMETSCFKEFYTATLTNIRKNYLNASHNFSKARTNINSVIFINWANIALRYGLVDLIDQNFTTIRNREFTAELELLKELTKIEIRLSNGEFVCVSGLLNLARSFINEQNNNLRQQIRILIPLIVNFNRHQKNASFEDDIIKYSKKLFDLLTAYENSTFSNKLLCSIGYRGLAMASIFDSERKSTFLQKAETLAKSMKYTSQLEKLIIEDNLFTCYQTMSKWFSSQKNFQKAEAYLQGMMKIDPFDSVSYSELGFFYIHRENFKLACQQFKKAYELGPPGVGMNMYYYAKCLEKLGNEEESIRFLYQTTKIDTKAISPWLDLIDYYSLKKDHPKLYKISNHILNSPVLFEQLESHEIKTIKTFAY